MGQILWRAYTAAVESSFWILIGLALAVGLVLMPESWRKLGLLIGWALLALSCLLFWL